MAGADVSVFLSVCPCVGVYLRVRLWKAPQHVCDCAARVCLRRLAVSCIQQLSATAGSHKRSGTTDGVDPFNDER